MKMSRVQRSLMRAAKPLAAKAGMNTDDLLDLIGLLLDQRGDLDAAAVDDVKADLLRMMDALVEPGDPLLEKLSDIMLAWAVDKAVDAMATPEARSAWWSARQEDVAQIRQRLQALLNRARA